MGDAEGGAHIDTQRATVEAYLDSHSLRPDDLFENGSMTARDRLDHLRTLENKTGETRQEVIHILQDLIGNELPPQDFKEQAGEHEALRTHDADGVYGATDVDASEYSG
jgi:hypothetical protein